MATRITIPIDELAEYYSPAPFLYSFEYLLDWRRPHTYPILPPEIETLSDEAIAQNAKTIAQDVIDRIEASRPFGTPGLREYLAKHYSIIDKKLPNHKERLLAKKQFLTELQQRIIANIPGTFILTARHIYDHRRNPIDAFELLIRPYIGKSLEFRQIQGTLLTLIRCITAAQVEITLGKSLKQVHYEIKSITKLISKTESNKQPLKIQTITLSTSPYLQLSANQGAITTDKFSRALEKTLRFGIQALKGAGETAATRIFNLGIGALLYSPTLGNSDLYDDSALGVPASLLIQNIPKNLYESSINHENLESPYRISANRDTYTLFQHAGSYSDSNRIPLRPLFLDTQTNSYTSTPSKEFPIKLSFPIHKNDNSSTATPGEQIQAYPYSGITLSPIKIETTPLPSIDQQNFKDCIYCFPPDSGLPPLYVVFNSPYPGATTVGTYSGRPYNPKKAGGPIKHLDWREATFTRAGVDLVKLHISRFDPSDANVVMIDRLEKILLGKIEQTDTDKRFITHELRELERFRALGIADRILPNDRGEAWNNTHAATLEDYQLSSEAELLYTPEALEADRKQLERDY